MNTDTMGVYGNYYLKRAIVTQLGLGANLPEDAIYPMNLADAAGKPLDGANNYTHPLRQGRNAASSALSGRSHCTIRKVSRSPIASIASLSAVGCPSSTMPDGSLDLYFQNESPGADKETNWLPAPKGPFNLTMRLYAPMSDALTGKWSPPSVTKDEGPAVLTAQ